jgi:hypothetical protein
VVMRVPRHEELEILRDSERAAGRLFADVGMPEIAEDEALPPWHSRRPSPASATAPTRFPMSVWDKAARHYDERALTALVMAIANINVWNRFNVATGQLGGAYES